MSLVSRERRLDQSQADFQLPPRKKKSLVARAHCKGNEGACVFGQARLLWGLSLHDLALLLTKQSPWPHQEQNVSRSLESCAQTKTQYYDLGVLCPSGFSTCFYESALPGPLRSWVAGCLSMTTDVVMISKHYLLDSSIKTTLLLKTFFCLCHN